MAVYFAEAGGYIKIGYSKDPLSRATSITTNGTRPADLPHGALVDLIGWIPGGLWDEGKLHAQFIDARVAGEWFRIDREEIRSVVWDHPAGVDLHHMSALAALAAIRCPGVTRDQIASVGIPVVGISDDAAAGALFADFSQGRAA